MAEHGVEVQAQTRLAQAELIDAGFRPARAAGPVRLLRRLVWPFVRPFHFHTLDRVAAADAAIARLEAEVRRLSGLVTDPARLHALEVRLDTAEARADAAAGDITRLESAPQQAAPDTARLDALEAGIHALRDARRPAREQEVARLDRIEQRLDGLEVWADGQRRLLEGMESSRDEDLARLGALHTRLRSDLLAVGNRHVWVEDRIAAALEMVEQLRPLREGLFLTVLKDGVFLLKTGDLISEHARRDGVWDPHVVGIAARAADVVRGRTTPSARHLAIDVGAHFGLITVAIAKLFDTVVSFEPNTFNAALLRVNVMLNGLDGRVDVRREAASDREGSLSLAPGGRQEIPLPLDEDGRFASGTASNLGAYSFVQDGTGLSQANVVALDTLALDGVAFIKVDAQGGDGLVLLGAMQTIARCRPWVVFEWKEHLAQAFAVTFAEVEARLGGIGYQVRVLRRHNAKQVDYLALPEEEAGAVADDWTT